MINWMSSDFVHLKISSLQFCNSLPQNPFFYKKDRQSYVDLAPPQ